MLDLTSFSDLLSRLNPGIPFAIAADPQTAESAPEAPRSPQADVLDLSSIQSNNSGSSFDRVPVEDAGVYQPATIQAGGFMHFGLNLSIERQAVYTSTGGGGRAVFQALESASLSYQSEFAAGRNTLGEVTADIMKNLDLVFLVAQDNQRQAHELYWFDITLARQIAGEPESRPALAEHVIALMGEESIAGVGQVGQSGCLFNRLQNCIK